jgi:cytidyltransferase-like protein
MKKTYSKAVVRLYNLCKLFAENGIKHWLDYGTLLHLYRDGKLNCNVSTGESLGDFDMDVSVLSEDWDKIIEICNKHQIFIVPKHPYQYIRIGTRPLDDCHDDQEGDIDPFIDLHLWHPNPTKDLVYNGVRHEWYTHIVQDLDDGISRSSLWNWCAEVQRSFKHLRLTKKYFLEELEIFNVQGYNFLIPRYVEQFLQSRYGSRWRVPMTFTEFKDNRLRNVKAEGLLEQDSVTVYVDGVWDLFHQGHVELLRKVHNLYDEVVVGCTSDDVAEQYKRRPIVCFKDRVKVLEACRYVDRVVEAPLYHAAAFLDKHNIDYIVHAVEDLSNWEEELICTGEEEYNPTNFKSGYNRDLLHRIHVLPYTGYHSTDIIEKIKNSSSSSVSTYHDDSDVYRVTPIDLPA